MIQVAVLKLLTQKSDLENHEGHIGLITLPAINEQLVIQLALPGWPRG